MTNLVKISCFFFCFQGLAWVGDARHIFAESEGPRLIPLRGVGSVHIFNHRGSISVKGVSGEQLKLAVIERVAMGPPLPNNEATQAARAAQVLVDQRGDSLSIGLSYLSTLSLEERLKERKLSLSEFDLEVEVPMGRTLELFSSGKELRVDRFSGSLSARAEAANVVITRSEGRVQVSCRGCSAVIDNLKGSLSVSGIARDSRVERIDASDVSWSSFGGDIKMREIQAKNAVISLGVGRFIAEGLDGNFMVDSDQSSVEMKRLRGNVSLRVGSGDVKLGIERWRDPGALSVIESASGNVTLEVGAQNHFLLEIWSKTATPDVRIPNRVRLDERGEIGPQPLGRMRLQVGRGGSELLVRAGRGEIRVLPAP